MEKTDDASDSGAVVSLDGRAPISDDELWLWNEPARLDRTQERAATGNKGGAAPSSGANSGLWTDEEHRRFVVAFRQHPRMWTKIAACVGTRTKVQVRTHALRFLKKLAREAIESGEDARNVAALGTLGPKTGASRQIVGIGEEEEATEASGSVEEGGANDAESNIRSGRWTREEHCRFLGVIEDYGRDWHKIAAVVKTRSALQVRTHAQKWHRKRDKAKAKPSSNESDQNENEDKAKMSNHGSRQIKNDYGRNRHKITAVVGTQSALQVRTHAQKWHQKLDKAKAKPSSNGADQNGNEDKAEISDNESRQSEEELGQIVSSDEDTRKEAGLDQDRASEGMNCVKVQDQAGRENDCLDKRRGHWSKEEHSLFLGALGEHGRDWHKIAAAVKTRTVEQVRTHAQKYYQKLGRAKLVSNVARQNENERSANFKSKTESMAYSIRRGPTATATLPSAAPTDEFSEPSRKRRKVCVANAKAGCPAPPHKLGQHYSAPPKIVADLVPPTSRTSRGAAASGDSREFTQEEHILFLTGTLMYGKDWKKVAAHVKSRSAAQVKTHAWGWYMKRWLLQERERLLEAWSK